MPHTVWACDFETTTDPEDCRVWAWVAISVDAPDDLNLRVYGNDIQTFIDWAVSEKRLLFFHNLRFDGAFILWRLFHSEYTYFEKNKAMPKESFNALIGDMGQFYQIMIQGRRYRTEIRDSLKILPMSIAKMAKDFKIPEQKLELDYDSFREIGHKLTEHEKDYITNDALILARVLKILRAHGVDKLTIGAAALSYYKKTLSGGKGNSEENFRKLFPSLPDQDAYIRKSYKGGFVYANPEYVDRDVGPGIVLDVNSLYPYVMHSPFLYPFGYPEKFEGRYPEKGIPYRPLYIQRFVCQFELKPRRFPSIQIKHDFRFKDTEYLTDSKGCRVELTLTNVDLELFFYTYDVYDITWIDGYAFYGASGLFDNYIDYWYGEKAKAKVEGNSSWYQICKLFNNNLYGKFSTNPLRQGKVPSIDPDGDCLRYLLGDEEETAPVSIAVGTFVTSYAREKTIRAADALYDRFLYADTDSLHLLGMDLPEDLEIDDYILGAWKHEGIFMVGRYLGAKMYEEILYAPDADPETAKLKITGAGMPDEVKKQIKYDDFRIGLTVQTGKLVPRSVPGGVVLVSTPFTLKPRRSLYGGG